MDCNSCDRSLLVVGHGHLQSCWRFFLTILLTAAVLDLQVYCPCKAVFDQPAQLTIDEFCCHLSSTEEVFPTNVSAPFDIASGSGPEQRGLATRSCGLHAAVRSHPTSQETLLARARHSTCVSFGEDPPRSQANLVRVLSGSLCDRKLRSARKSIWCSGICCKRSGSTSQLGTHSQHFLSRCMNIRSAPRSGPRVLKGSKTVLSASAVPEGRSMVTSTQIELRQAPSLQQENQALTRQQQRHCCVIGFFVQQSGLEADGLSHRAILGFVSYAPSCSSDAFDNHVVSRRILQDLACGGGDALSQRGESRQMSLAIATPAPGNSTVWSWHLATSTKHFRAAHLCRTSWCAIPSRKKKPSHCEQHQNCNSSHQIAFAASFRSTRTRPRATHDYMSQPLPSKLLRAPRRQRPPLCSSSRFSSVRALFASVCFAEQR